MREILRDGKMLLGIEVQFPWARMIMEGVKGIETRRYGFPENMLECPLLLLQTGTGLAGISSIPDAFDVSKGKGKLWAIGIVVFDECFQYTSREQWEKDIPLHCVTKDSLYAYNKDVMFGWRIKKFVGFASPIEICKGERWFRSFLCVQG